eukprot:1642112-Ditylum_brightwellii.AAC.1
MDYCIVIGGVCSVAGSGHRCGVADCFCIVVVSADTAVADNDAGGGCVIGIAVTISDCVTAAAAT